MTLKPEPANQYDPYAVEVFDAAGLKLGHVPKFLAPRVQGACLSPVQTVSCHKLKEETMEIIIALAAGPDAEEEVA